MEMVLNYSTANITDHTVHQSPISSVSLDDKCFQPSLTSSDDGSNVDHLNELIRQKFNDATVIVSVVVLVLINFVVIAGNILVILSVFASTKLRTVTNFFIGKGVCHSAVLLIRLLPCTQFPSQWLTF